MKRILIILAFSTLIVGCTYPWQRNPSTGEIPIVEGIKDAGGSLSSGNWLGAAIAFVVGTASACFATKKRKDGQLGEVVAAVEKFKEGKGGSDVLLGLLTEHTSPGTKKLIDKLIAGIAKKDV